MVCSPNLQGGLFPGNLSIFAGFSRGFIGVCGPFLEVVTSKLIFHTFTYKKKLEIVKNMHKMYFC